MGAGRLLLLALLVMALAWAVSAGGRSRRVPAFLQLLVAALFVASAVRIGLSIAILAFDLTPLSLLLPISFGLAAWWLSPKPPPRGQVVRRGPRR